MDIAELLKISVEMKASDLHLSAGMPPLLRIDGELAPLPQQEAIEAEAMASLILGIMDKAQQDEFRDQLELDFAKDVPGVGRFRVNVFHQTKGVAAVFRVIPTMIPTLEELGLPDVMPSLLNLPNGLILVTGPTGSGKTTTLAAMVDYINKHQAAHIITIEDPVEFTFKSQKALINQREVHRDTKNFAAALRSALREDPDVILLGEMRDLESIRLALTAAETGHLVLATLHTSSAPRSISRIVDVFSAEEKNIIRNMLSESIQAVICQTLVKRKLGGRVAALEMMIGNPAIRNLIREDKISQMYTVIQTSSALGMCTLAQSLQSLRDKQIID